MVAIRIEQNRTAKIEGRVLVNGRRVSRDADLSELDVLDFGPVGKVAKSRNVCLPVGKAVQLFQQVIEELVNLVLVYGGNAPQSLGHLFGVNKRLIHPVDRIEAGAVVEHALVERHRDHANSGVEQGNGRGSFEYVMYVILIRANC